MSPSLPERPDLEQLKKQARERRRESGQPLHVVQRELAQAYGFASWPRLVAHVRTLAEHTWTLPARDASEPAGHRMLRLACLNYTDDSTLDVAAATALLDSADRSDLAVAAVAGDAAAVRAALDDGADPNAAWGPFGWPALMLLTYSRLPLPAAAVVDIANGLLDAGADPNAGRYFGGFPTPFTVLTGVFGGGEGDQPPHRHETALARVLLSAGADPNDAQTLYNRQFGTDDSFLGVLFEYGLGTGDGGPWRRRLPDLSDAPTDMVRMLLDWAVTHGQADRVALLVAHGVDVLAPLPDDGRAPILAALANGHRDIAGLLRDAGAAEPEQSPSDAFVGAVLAGDRATVAAMADAVVADVRATRPGLAVWAAAQGRVAGVELLAAAGFDLDALARGDVPKEQPWQTALHSAVEHDHAEVVRALVRLGARTDIRDARFDGTPADWARHFGRDHLLALLDG